MPAPVIADTFRVRLIFENDQGKPNPVNILHVYGTTADVGDVGANFSVAFADPDVADIFRPLNLHFTCSSVGVTPLDGTSAETIFTGLTELGGFQTGQLIPNMAVIVSMHTGQIGPRGRGRVFLGPITEDVNTGDGVVDSTIRTLTNDAWHALATSLGTAATPTALAVASYVHQDVHVVTSLVTKQMVGTQRRRLDAYR